jgi:hypothetical protein|tara:strand:- start:77 stop:487 length:411 start_codon:yes stop_codon:yes gene_type:complete
MNTFELTTLVDITKTNARRGEDKIAYGQQQNYMSVLQTLGLRTNVEISDPVFKKQKATGFGSEYATKNLNVWRCIITVEQDESHSIEMMQQDFNLIPVIRDLNENVNLKEAIFWTSDPKKCNILFKILPEDDKYSI